MPVSDLEKILKNRGSLKPTTAVYQLRQVQPKAKIPLEMVTSQEAPTKTLFEETSTKTVEVETLNPNLAFPEVKSEAHSTISCINEGDNPLVKLASVDIPPMFQLDFPTSQSLEEYTIYSDSTPTGSPIYISCKSEEPSPRILFPPFSVFSSPEEAKDPLYIFQNPLYNVPVSSPRVSMVAVGGGGGGAAGGGAGGQGPPPPPRIFAKVVSIYAPLVLPVPLHDLPENYMKKLPKFTGEGDLTATEHINFFDQFADILGLEHEDVYSRLFVQNFEGQVRT
jgi:hypothetical protein